MRVPPDPGAGSDERAIPAARSLSGPLPRPGLSAVCGAGELSVSPLPLLACGAALVAGAAWVVFPSPPTSAAAIVALGLLWLIERAACAKQIRLVQAAGGIVNYPALRCIGYATTMSGIVGGGIVAVRVLFALLVEAPAP